MCIISIPKTTVRVFFLFTHSFFIYLQHNQTIFFSFQNILHVISDRWESLEGYDVASGSLNYSRFFFNEQPYALTVYDAETVGTYTGKSVCSLYRD